MARVFAAYPPRMRRKLLALRALIFRTAAVIDGVGALAETLKWGEPAYLTAESGSGSTIRIGWKPSAPSQYAMYFHCGTNLVARFRRAHAGALEFEGNRAIVFAASDPVPVETLAECIAAALTYHRRRPGRTVPGRSGRRSIRRR